jgi:hypothetical protein
VQLNWSEFYQGQWSERLATDINKTEIINVQSGFDVSQIHIHISTEPNDAAILVHLDFPQFYESIYMLGVLLVVLLGGDVSTVPRANHAFRITSKNCDPAFSGMLWSAPPAMPYGSTGVDATVYTGSGSLQASFQSNITSTGSQTETEKILQSVHNFALVTTANAVAPPFLDASEPAYWEAGSLVSPFFYKDRAHGATKNELTFFAQPSLTETTLSKWTGWAVPVGVAVVQSPSWFNDIQVAAQVPSAPVPINPGDPAHALYPLKARIDWATNPATAISFSGAWIGREGAINPATIDASAKIKTALADAASGLRIETLPSGSLAAHERILMTGQGLNERQLQMLETARNTALSNHGVLSGVTALRQLGSM